MEAGAEHGIVDSGYRAIDALSSEKGRSHIVTKISGYYSNHVVTMVTMVMNAGAEHGIVDGGYRAIDALSSEKGRINMTLISISPCPHRFPQTSQHPLHPVPP